ncbi:MAG: dTMP kinase [Candidatus Omnitrophota bacterium]
MAKKRLKKGAFITFEGPEGSGKSLQSLMLLDHLKRGGFSCVHTREPGGTRLGERIRTILLDPDSGLAINDMAELFLFEACRAQVTEEIIRPAIEKKKIVLCDRFGDATVAYQGYAGGLDPAMIQKLNMIATGGTKPDLTILLDVDVKIGLSRAKIKTVDRMEKKAISYHRLVHRGYLRLAGEYPSRFRVVRVEGTIDQVHQNVRREVERYLRTIETSR